MTSWGSEDGWDMAYQLKSKYNYIRSLPTKADFEQNVKLIEKIYKQVISELKKDIGARFEDIENTMDDLHVAVQLHKEILNSHTSCCSTSHTNRMT